jgi:hypothetical protein
VLLNKGERFIDRHTAPRFAERRASAAQALNSMSDKLQFVVERKK